MRLKSRRGSKEPDTGSFVPFHLVGMESDLTAVLGIFSPDSDCGKKSTS